MAAAAQEESSGISKRDLKAFFIGGLCGIVVAYVALFTLIWFIPWLVHP